MVSSRIVSDAVPSQGSWHNGLEAAETVSINSGPHPLARVYDDWVILRRDYIANLVIAAGHTLGNAREVLFEVFPTAGRDEFIGIQCGDDVPIVISKRIMHELGRALGL